MKKLFNTILTLIIAVVGVCAIGVKAQAPDSLKMTGKSQVNPIGSMHFYNKSVTYNGKTVYVYRVQQDDAQMQKVLKEAKEKGKVKVNITGQEMEYAARVNQDYLMLYDSTIEMNDIVSAFDSYTYK